nr:integrase, catalytic region, zinc finger, CCHC-type, peptidase aspartic, catalytic [Tanacetum cinerariifolium]
YASQAPSSTNLSISYPPSDIQSSVNHIVYNASSSIPQMEYAPAVHPQSEFSPPETGLVVLVFQKGDDPINAINHMMSFLKTVVTSSVIEKSDAIVIHDSEETLLLTEESRSKMIQKQNEPIMSEKKVNTKPVDYTVLNQLLKDFKTRFVPHDELSAEQAFWFRFSVQSEEPNLSVSTTIVEVPKELPKVSMVNSSLKKLRFHLASFDMVVKERTTATTITKGTWGFEHTKACFRDDIIPFVKALKELFNSFDQFLIDELTEVQNGTKLVAENEHLKQTYKQLYDSIKSSCVRSKEQCLSKLKGKDVVNKAVPLHSIDPELLKIDVAPLALKLRKNMIVHTDYLRHTQVETATLREIVESERLLHPLNTSLDYACKEIVESERLLHPLNTSLDYACKYACKYAKRIQELLIILQQTCPCITDLGRVNLLSSASGSQSQDNTKNDKIQRTPRKAKKNKLEDHLRTIRPSLNKKSGVDTKSTSSVTNFMSNVNSDLKCATCNGCLFSDNHDSCVVAYINSVNASIKSKSVKKPVDRKIRQPTGKMFTTIVHVWKPTGRNFTLVRNVSPLTRIATTAIVPLREPIPIESNTDKPVVTLVYSRKSKAAKKKVPVSNPKINKSLVVKIVLWYLDFGCSKHITGDRSQLINFVQKFLGTVKFGNDHVVKIMGFGDYKIGNVTISRVYFVEGLGHNLFSVGQFYDSDLEVAFRQHTCFIRNLDGVDLVTGSRENNLYTLSLQDMMASSRICLLSKASKTKSWLWHHRLSHLNFGAINHLARQGLVRGLPKLRFEKDHLCSACAMGKSMKKSNKPKFEDTNQEKIYLLHMDLCGPMRVESVNGKKYILVIVDDYSRFTWVKFFRSKDETPDFIIKFPKMIQVRLKSRGCGNRLLYPKSIRHSPLTWKDTIENLGKLQLKANIGIFIGYAPTKKAFRIYNRRTRRIVETIHIDFDELTAMASEQSSSGPALKEMTPATISLGLVQKSSPSTPYVPPSRND